MEERQNQEVWLTRGAQLQRRHSYAWRWHNHRPVHSPHAESPLNTNRLDVKEDDDAFPQVQSRTTSTSLCGCAQQRCQTSANSGVASKLTFQQALQSASASATATTATALAARNRCVTRLYRLTAVCAHCKCFGCTLLHSHNKYRQCGAGGSQYNVVAGRAQ